jgi:outer membrane protein assembly factor BamB
VANGVVYVGASNYMYALNASTGALLWSSATFRPVSTSPVVANGMLYYATDYGGVYAFGLK